MTDNNIAEIPAEYKNLKCVRIELNSHKTIFLYYKIYPKENSSKYPQNWTAILFYFDSELDDKFFWLYLSLVGQVESVDWGSFFNKKGSKSKRRTVSFAIVKFTDEESLTELMDQYNTQKKINEFLETKKNRNVNLIYDPLKDTNGEEEENEVPDEDGFVEVKKNNAKRNFSKGELSFKISKNQEDDEESVDVRLGRKKRKMNKLNTNEFYWNYQALDKKKEMYEELKTWFDEDKKAINKKRKINE